MKRSDKPANDQPPHDDGQGDPTSRQVVLEKGGHRYVFRYHPGQEAQLIRGLAKLAGDPKSQIKWIDAAVLTHQLGIELRRRIAS